MDATALVLQTSSCSGNVVIGGILQIATAQTTFQNNVVNGNPTSSNAIAYNTANGTPQTWSGNSFECSGPTAANFSVANTLQARQTVSNFNFWFSANFGVNLQLSENCTLSGFSCIGNSSAGIVNQAAFVDVIFDSWDVQNNATYAQPYGWQLSSGNLWQNS